MILIRNIAFSPEEIMQKTGTDSIQQHRNEPGRSQHDDEITLLRGAVSERLKISQDRISDIKIIRKSTDARRGRTVKILYTVAASVDTGERKLLQNRRIKDIEPYKPFEYNIPAVNADAALSGLRPVVVGFGPAGVFAALALSKAGLRPIILERGVDVDSRRKAVEHFWETGELSPNANVQFGEGGAGTFSDGKLNTGTHDGRIAWVLEQFHRAGAPEKICYEAHPHMGTDVLRGVVRNLREQIISLGGEVRFQNKFKGIIIRDGNLEAVTVDSPNGEYELSCKQVILAPGHSARDTFEMLLQSGVPMEPKPFSMGVRIEHLQSEISKTQYGDFAEMLPPAEYWLNCRLPDGTSAYTFCMCPGGHVVAASSEQRRLCTNGMSYSARDGENANAALLVTLTPEDFPDKGVLSGMYWQRELEEAAYNCGGGNYLAPAQKVGDFLAGKPSMGPGTVKPTYRPGVVWCELHEVLPERLTKTLEQAIPELGKKLPGFDNPEAVLTAPETRSSSPVRILRNETGQSAIYGIYPCGEGAGYAGGITSAAVDGLRAAEDVIRSYDGGNATAPKA